MQLLPTHWRGAGVEIFNIDHLELSDVLSRTLWLKRPMGRWDIQEVSHPAIGWPSLELLGNLLLQKTEYAVVRCSDD